MKKFLLLFACAFIAMPIFAQTDAKKPEEKKQGYVFTMIDSIPVTPVKNQFMSGTCWNYSAIGLFEAEALRETGKVYDLSEGYGVYETYIAKADNYVRLHGHASFGQGGLCHDVTWCFKNYGIVPESVYSGMVAPDTLFNHMELSECAKSFLDGIMKSKTLSDHWKTAFTGILNAYLGEPPTEFTYEGVKYTPKSFLASLKINPDDYVSVTSFSNHEFYKPFIVEVEDNWLHGSAYNVPLDDMMRIIDNALENGYTVNWGSDVSNKGFSWKNGVAILPDKIKDKATGSDEEHWNGKSKDDLYAFDGNVIEKNVTQEDRQEAFDNWTTTDDHGMLLCGIAKDQNGNRFYLVKNSWGTDGIYKGYFYVSVPFVRMSTTDLLINKNAIPKDIRKKLGI